MYSTPTVSNSNVVLQSSFFSLSLIRKHLTLRKVIIGLLTLIFVTCFKLLIVGGTLVDPINYSEVLLLSFYALIFRLSILGFVEHICEEYLSDFKLGNTLFMNAGNEGQGGGNPGNQGQGGGNAGNEGQGGDNEDDDDDWDEESSDPGYDSEDNRNYGFETPPPADGRGLNHYIVEMEAGVDGVEYDREMAEEAINIVRRDPSTWTAEDEETLYEADVRNLEQLKNSAQARVEAESRFAQNVYANSRSAERGRANLEEALALRADIEAKEAAEAEARARASSSSNNNASSSNNNANNSNNNNNNNNN
jgi:hypothetical protein